MISALREMPGEKQQAVPPKAVRHNIDAWLQDNKDHFKPPVCNYMMHGDGRLKVMFVGGPNIRKDFHLEEGEEFFYMVKGDMVLTVLEKGIFRDVAIKEGEVFQLPGKVLHSPQRYANTMGLVIERERMKDEMDCVRYFVDGTTDTLYEEWFYCADLGIQLGPLIKRYFASEQHKTGKPIPGTIFPFPPFVPDAVRALEKPFHLMTWVKKHMEEIQTSGSKRLWDITYQSDVVAMGVGEDKDVARGDEETWLWQLVGTSTVTIAGVVTELSPQDSVLLKANTVYSHVRPLVSVCLSVNMTWSSKNRAFEHLPEPAQTSGTSKNNNS